MNKAGRLLILSLAVTILATGCWVRSLHPIYTEKDLIFDENLVGTWEMVDKDGNEKATMIFHRLEKTAYRLSYGEKGDTAEFEVHLTRIGERTFLDLYPELPADYQGVDAAHVVRAHGIVRIAIGKDETRFELLDHEWLKGALEKEKLGLAYQIVDGAVILEASTEELRAFLEKYGESKRAFSNCFIMTRR